MEKKHINRLLAALVALSLLLFAVLAGWLIYDHTHAASFSGQPMQQASKYMLYVGTNDPATHTQPVPTEEMKAQVDTICEKHVEGFTVFRANGNWFDATGTQVREDTLVYCFYNATDDQIKAVMDEVLGTFHQSALVLEKTDADIIFYSGNARQ
ncbi:DUF3574 domain-containing protein [Candidatus Formimonas warabiya]|uniref:DUF3574 domain-containing protein n=1 Tax=Formimonas warabiya TaxID=1761012 RepID=A0A3G1KWT3_FORW1|nr:DUF3574 domain-containing protein [Candidatus Formimonas warabiya]ATW26665.1 hypothetical protein DCMF_19595 [Candidatus Formimonas warabiya]